jgi:hypothetical protein
MLAIFTLLLVLIVGYALFSQGLLTAFTTMVNVLLAGLVAFNFWEPAASMLAQQLSGTPVLGFEDYICMVGIFGIVLVVLRIATGLLATTELELPPAMQQGGAAVCGMITGYLTAGFLVCAMQTLPLPDDFLGFSARADLAGGVRRYLPPDRVWLAMMQRGSFGPLATDGDGFDPRGYFELGYARHRRTSSGHAPLDYYGEDIPIKRGAQ